jgi:mannan endo-1,4-beta-mannosidase
MMYRELAVRHRLGNLLWVTSSGGDPSYFPGSQYVDVAGADIYSANRSAPGYAFQSRRLGGFAPGKPAALTEVGLLPTPSILLGACHYVWVCPWWGGYLDRDYYHAPAGAQDRNTAATIREFYAAPATLDLDAVAQRPGNKIQ